MYGDAKTALFLTDTNKLLKLRQEITLKNGGETHS